MLHGGSAARLSATALAAFWLAGAMTKPARGAGTAPRTMNAYVADVVKDFAAFRAGGGYDINKAFTRDLDYGAASTAIRATDRTASPPKPTMCVAAAAEVIIETLNRYAKATADQTPFKRLPPSSWTKGNLTSIKANLFMFSGTGSRGTGHTLEKFGIGKEKTFTELNPYDFVNLNRQHSGHAVVFIGFLGKDYKPLDRYSSDVVGFQYFSAQGKGKADAGFAYRYAFFAPYCPDAKPGMARDCGVIKSLKNKALLDGGELWEPAAWTIEKAQTAISAGVTRAVLEEFHGAPRALVDSIVEQRLEQELTFQPERLDGETTD
jgi:hypothetical protein